MKRLYNWVIVCVGVVVVGITAGFALRLCTALARSQIKVELLDPSDPEYKEVMCGPVSMSVALGRLGINISPANVASRCQVTARGVAMIDLERAANDTHLVSACVRKLSWDEARSVDGVAVLFVNGDHYLTVDPRESRRIAAKAAMVRIYEPEKPAQWWSREKLERIWAGETLVITKRAAHSNELKNGACIDWDECFVDQGILRDTPIAHYQFSFRNVGSSDLVIGEIQKSCGCIEHSLSLGRLAPGEAAVLKVSVDLRRAEGYMQQNIVVQTNDVTSPISILKMAAGVPRSHFISSDVIRLADLPLGGKVFQKFYVADPGFSGAKVREARFVLHSNPSISEHLSCLVSSELIGRNGPAEFDTKPDDHVIRLSFEASKVCPLGLFQGEILVVLEVDDAVTTHKVAIEGMVVQDVHPVPRVALIALDPKGAGSATIQLQSYLKQDFRVVKVWSDNGNSLDIRPEGDSPSANSKYVIAIHNSDMIPGAAPMKQTTFLELNDGSVVSVRACKKSCVR